MKQLFSPSRSFIRSKSDIIIIYTPLRMQLYDIRIFIQINAVKYMNERGDVVSTIFYDYYVSFWAELQNILF